MGVQRWKNEQWKNGYLKVVIVMEMEVRNILIVSGENILVL